MAYMGPGSTGNKDSHGWAIAGAFAGQAAIIIGIGALLAGAGTMQTGSQVGVPMIAAPPPAISVMPDIQQPPVLPYQLEIDGQTDGGVVPVSPPPSFTVKPGQDLTVTLDVTTPPAQGLSNISVSLVGPALTTGAPNVQTPYNDSVQFQSPGTQVLQLTWQGSAAELQPGTQWTLYMSADTPSGSDSGSIATISVAS